MRYLTTLFVLVGFICLISRTTWAIEEYIDEEEFNPGSTECDGLEEKIEIFLNLQEAISEDFAKITDPMLCDSIADQCEDFYSRTKEYQALYQDRCDENYEIIKLSKCDYSSNPCTRKQNLPFKGLHVTKDKPLVPDYY